MARLTPTVQGETLTWYVETHEHQLAVGTAAWYSWLQEASLFAFVTESGGFTARKEMKPHGPTYWKAYRKRGGRLYHAYLGKSEQLTLERLNAIAVLLARRAEGKETPSAHEFAQEILPESTPHDITVVTRPASNLPVPLTSLIGREQERARVYDLLQRPEVRLLTLTGTGGIGKTRLALQVATDLLADFADGVSFVLLAPVSEPDLVVPTIAQTLGLKEIPGQAFLSLLKTSLSEKHLLFLLDNFEQVVAAAPQLSELLIACPHLKILVTSRAVLHIRGEHEFAVPPLALPDLTQLPESETLAQVAAVALFLQRAWATKPDLQLTSTNARAIAQICVQLDGLPLAIELAAARSKLLPPQALLARLGQRFAILTSGAQDAPARQQTLHDTIAWSYNLLNAKAQQLFRRLSVFVGGCTLQAVERLCHSLEDGRGGEWILDGVASLIDKSLLQQTEREGEEPRLMMLETIREYGLECLTIGREVELTRQAHAAYYLAFAEAADAGFWSPQKMRGEQVTWLERLEREHDNLRAAMQWVLEQEAAGHSIELALRLATALEWPWHALGHLSEGRSFLAKALAASEAVVVPPHVRARALVAAGMFAMLQGDIDQTQALAQESLLLCRACGDTHGTARSLHHLQWVARQRGDLASARALAEENLAFRREAGDKVNIAYGLVYLADIALLQGEYPRARALYEESVAMQRVTRNQWGLVQSLLALARGTFVSQGDPATVDTLLQEGLALCRGLGDKEDIAGFLSLAGQVTLSQGDPATARSLLEESMMLLKEMGHLKGGADSLSVADSLCALGRVIATEGNHTAARALFEESLAFGATADKLALAPSLEGLATVVAAQGEATWAARLWCAAAAQRDAYGTPLLPVFRTEYERAVTAASTQIGEKTFAAAWAEGRTMTLEHVLAAQGPVSMAAPLPADLVTAPAVAKASTYGLTPREFEVLRLVAQGLTDTQVAEKLVISPHTVNSHLKAIYGKLGVSSRSAATRYAIEHHLL